MRALLAALACCVLAACATRPDTAARMPDAGGFSAILHETATSAAVAKPGIKVCREMAIGIGERDWLRGIVESAGESRILVKITNAGRFPHLLNGAQISIGDSVLDTAVLWTPCY